MPNLRKYSDVLLSTLLCSISLWSVSVNADPLLQSQLANGSTKSFANFGSAVAVTDSFTLVGTPGKQSNSGEACLFFRSQSTWTMTDCLTPVSDTQSTIKQFGSAVASSDQSVIIAARHQGGQTGAVYIFSYENGSWIQQGEFTKPGEVINNFFGQAVSISGDLAAIGSPGGANDDGSVYVYKRTDSNWTLNYTITPDLKQTLD